MRAYICKLRKIKEKKKIEIHIGVYRNDALLWTRSTSLQKGKTINPDHNTFKTFSIFITVNDDEKIEDFIKFFIKLI